MVRRAAEGDQFAWEGLIAEFTPTVAGAARAYRLSEADQADVVQTTWLRLIEHLGRIEDPDAIGAWLSKTAGREAVAVLRRAKRQVPTDQIPESTTDDDIDQRLVTRESHAAVRTAFRRLKSTDQALLSLLVCDWSPSYAQIGEILEMPVGSIGPTRARSLVRLRREAARVGLTADRTDARARGHSEMYQGAPRVLLGEGVVRHRSPTTIGRK